MSSPPRSNPSNVKTVTIVLIVLVLVLLILTIYELTQIYSLENADNQLQAENYSLNGEIASLESELFSLQNQISSTHTSSGGPNQFIWVAGACLSISANCNGTYAYLIGIHNNSSETFNSGYSIFLSFKDITTPNAFEFNTTLPFALATNSQVNIVATTWPSYQNGTSYAAHLKQGDNVSLSVGIQSYSAVVQIKVQ